jgi:hypothetical protein
MKPSKTNVPASARPHESKQTRFKILFEKLDALRLEAATQEIGVREKIQIGDPDALTRNGKVL